MPTSSQGWNVKEENDLQLFALGQLQPVEKPGVLFPVLILRGVAVQTPCHAGVHTNDGHAKASIPQLPEGSGLGNEPQPVGLPQWGRAAGAEVVIELPAPAAGVVLVVTGNRPDGDAQATVGLEGAAKEVLLPASRVGNAAVDDHEIWLETANDRESRVLGAVPLAGVAEDQKPDRLTG